MSTKITSQTNVAVKMAAKSKVDYFPMEYVSYNLKKFFCYADGSVKTDIFTKQDNAAKDEKAVYETCLAEVKQTKKFIESEIKKSISLTMYYSGASNAEMVKKICLHTHSLRNYIINDTQEILHKAKAKGYKFVPSDIENFAAIVPFSRESYENGLVSVFGKFGNIELDSYKTLIRAVNKTVGEVDAKTQEYILQNYCAKTIDKENKIKNVIVYDKLLSLPKEELKDFFSKLNSTYHELEKKNKKVREEDEAKYGIKSL